ncbi:MAG: hypothetical protein P4L83_05495 [Nevskia sp.]|nr:hypothetical protein [Nevskia sp.]
MDTTRLVRLEGNTRPEANPANDRGRVPDALPLEHLQLLLKRPPERELALQRTIEQLHDHRSPDFHRWLDPAEPGDGARQLLPHGEREGVGLVGPV